MFKSLCQKCAVVAWTGLLGACVAEREPLPTEVLVASANTRIERAEHPPLYQMLYDYAFLPEVQYKEQRVRILIWLKHMDFSDFQLRAMKELYQKSAQERRRIEDAQQAVVSSYEPRMEAVYEELWLQLRQGVEVSAPALEESARALLSERLQHAREQELLALRTQGVRTVLNATQDWLSTLDPRQEALLTDSLFFLRHRLDPYANAGDFKALVGSIFVAGDYGTLTRGSFSPEEDHLNLGALWTDQSLEERQGPIFNEARRGLILYMILLEPALPEAIDAALGAESGPPPDGPPPDGPPPDKNRPPDPGRPPEHPPPGPNPGQPPPNPPPR